MKTQVLTLAVVSACGFLPQAFAHELAYSKTEQIHVVVDGEATTWCKPDVAITMQRPTWDDQKPLIGLLGKLPFILTHECPTAKYTWRAVNEQGAVYASGYGAANNLGLVTLAAPPVAAPSTAVAATSVSTPTAPPAQAAPPVPAPAQGVATPDVASEPVEQVPVTSPAQVAAAPAPAPVSPPAAVATAPAPAPVPASEPAPAVVAVAPAPVVAPEAPPVAVAPVPAVAPAPTPAPAVVASSTALAAPAVQATPVTPAPPVRGAAVATAPTADYGRSIVAANTNLISIADGTGCKWLISKTAVDASDPSIAFTSTPAMPCGVSGFAEGSFEKLRWSIPNTYRGDTWSRSYVHPSGLIFNQSLSAAVKGKAVSFLSNNADQALFQVGEIPARSMKVYLAFQRSNYQVLSPFNSDPYYVAITPDESFALDPGELKRASVEVFQLIKATSPTTVSQENVYFAKSLGALYPNSENVTDEKGKILRSRMGESRGEFFFDAREGQNFTLRREEARVREARRYQEQMASVHTRILERYERLKEGMKGQEGHEAEALAQMVGIKVKFPTPLQMVDPASATTAVPMMIHVTGKSGEFYDIDFPRKGRIQADVDLENQWYVVQAANMTPFVALKDGRSVPTFRVYAAGVPEPCAQDHCADRVSFGAVLSKEFPNAGIDFNWTPAVSEKFVIAWQQASTTIQ